MPDPLTITAAITLAGKCINGVTKAVNSGRELESAMGHISRWFGDKAAPADSLKVTEKKTT